MDRLNTILKKDRIYTEQLEAYTIRDSGIAAIYYAVILVLYYVMGRILSATGVYLGSIVSLICMLIPVIICFKMFYMTGISTRNLKPALITGFVMGFILLVSICIVPNIIAGATVLPLKDIAYNVFYYFFIIGFSEEISFRGFIQPRLFPVFKKEWLMLLAGALLFVFMHYPFQMAARGMTFTEYWPMFIANAPFQFIWHYVFSWLYRRYGNIFGSTVFHGCIDMSMGIFG